MDEFLSADNVFDIFSDKDSLIVDVRSNSEYSHAHIPEAINIPLLIDAHRKVIGTVYKKEGKESAVQKGFELAGPYFYEMIKDVNSASNGKHVILYCWRGGLRSQIMNWVLTTAGISSQRIEGGYKAYRRKVLNLLEQDLNIAVLGGKTGSGKTVILEELKILDNQVIDLEKLANHKGSAFGGLGQPKQPSNEMFENLLGNILMGLNHSEKIWVENESRSIGKCVIPSTFFEKMRSSAVFEVEPGYKSRFERIKSEYGGFSFDQLSSCTLKIMKRLGPNKLKEAMDYLANNKFDDWLHIVLKYYDKQYEYSDSLRNEDAIFKIKSDSANEKEFALLLIEKFNEIKVGNE